MKKGTERSSLDRSVLLRMYETVVRIRVFEDKVAELYNSGRLPGLVHTYQGQEAVAAGICANLRKDDYICSSHRADGHCIAKGLPLRELAGELMGRETGCCRGKGGSMHLADIRNGVLGATGIVASGIPIAVGAGMSAKLRRTDQVSVAFFGDGAVANGAFHESVNLAAVWNLPVLFVCENNLYATWTPFSSVSKVGDVAERAKGYGIPCALVDGMDTISVYEAGREAVSRARGGGGPTLIECKTYRFYGHYVGDPDIRPKDEKESWTKRDPVKNLMEALRTNDAISEEELRSVEQRVTEEVERAMVEAEASPYPPECEATKDVFYEPVESGVVERTDRRGGIKEITMRDAINEALREEMARDETVLIYGQGYMGKRGGPFGVTKGLQDVFGPERVKDAPISELAMAGCALGASLTGAKPVVEIMFNDWLTLAMDQVVNHIAKARYVSGGQLLVPLVIRTTLGAAKANGPHHSQCFESWFMHVPGVKVVLPSTPCDAKGLLKASIRDQNPVIFMENKALYSLKGPVPTEEYFIPLGAADVKKEGSDVTIVTWSRMVHLSLAVAQRLESEGMSAEVLDLRTLAPLDKKTILQSVRKTGRALIVQEACKTGGAAAEISATIMEAAFESLKAPVSRVAAPDVPIPFSPSLEKAVIPNELRIEKALRELLSAS